MGGLIGVIAQETSRYSMFASSLTSLDVPPDTEIKWWWGHNIPENCNALVRYMYEQERDWLWLLGDDHTFSPHVLNALLAHEKDIVVPLCLMRGSPYAPVIYSDYNPESGLRRRVTLNDHEGGLIGIHSAGSAGMLIRRRVFDSLNDPWFEYGRVDTTMLAEDVYFCDKAREAGAALYCDLDTRIGHCFTGVVWPVPEADGWTVGFSMVGGIQIVVPPGTPV